MDDSQPADLPAANVTRAGVTGKVPQVLKRARRGGKAKAVKLSPDQRSHVRQLKNRGQISERAASSNGLQARR